MAYDKIRSLVEQHGGSMTFVRKGYRYGAWVIRIGGREKIIEAEGNHSLPDLDRLYEPKDHVSDPKTWDDYSKQLVPNAEAKLLAMLGLAPSG